MTELVEFQLEDGSSVLIEAEDVRGPAITRGGRATEAITRASDTLEEAVHRIGPTSWAIVEKLRELAQQPDEIDVEFGLKLNAEVGAIIARTSGEANFRIAVRWKRG